MTFFSRTSLARRFALTAALLAALAMLTVSGASWWLIHQQHSESMRSLLEKDAGMQATLVGNSLHGIVSRISEVANSSLITTALVDSAGKELYLAPFLRGIQRIQGVPVEIVFTDFEGEVIAKNATARFGKLERDWVRQRLPTARADAQIVSGEAGEEVIGVAFVVYARSGSAEGAIFYRFRLRDIARQETVRLIHGEQARTLARDNNVIVHKVDVPPVLRSLDLAVLANLQDISLQGELLPVLSIFLLTVGSAGAVLGLGTYLGQKLTAELRHLDVFARSIAEQGFGVARSEPVGSAEVASLARSINRMLDRLNRQHDSVQEESEERYRLLVEGSNAITFESIEPQARFSFVSPQAEIMLGYPLKSWLEPGFLFRHVHPDDRAALLAARARSGRADKNYRCEYRLLNAAGEPVWLEEIASLQCNAAGEPLAARGILLDIRQRKLSEEQIRIGHAKLDRIKNEFVSIVSHELRTPMTSIRGSLGLVLGGVVGDLPDQARMLIDIANKNCERLVRLINDILDIEKIESGKMEFHFAVCALKPLLQLAIDNNRGYCDQYQVRLRLADDIPDLSVHVDPDRLMQVLTNLLSNAAKFSPAQAEVYVHVQQMGDLVRVNVRDQGIGITPEHRDRIFMKFSQVDSSDARHKGGTGLGLSISQMIIEKMNGDIGFESTSGQGSSFYIDLPVHPVRELA